MLSQLLFKFFRCFAGFICFLNGSEKDFLLGIPGKNLGEICRIFSRIFFVLAFLMGSDGLKDNVVCCGFALSRICNSKCV